MKGKFLFAIVLILFGVGLLLDNLNIFYFGEVLSQWWPVAIILWGVSHISGENRSPTGGILVILVGLMLLGNSLDIIPSFWALFWPTLLIFIGIWVLTAKSRHDKRASISTDHSNIDQFVMFGGFEQRYEYHDLKGGQATAIFGGGEIDLRKCTLHGGTAELELNAFFGGIELIVPENWKIVSKGSPIFGGLSNKSRQFVAPDEIPQVLKINYMALFGGIEIKN